MRLLVVLGVVLCAAMVAVQAATPVKCSRMSLKPAVCTDPAYWAKAVARFNEAIAKDNKVAPTLVRLAWHASGTHNRTDRMWGSNGGTILFSPEKNKGPNNGLPELISSVMDPIIEEFSDISCGDLVVLGGVVAIDFMKGPKIDFRPGRLCFGEIKARLDYAPADMLLPPALVSGDAVNNPHHPLTMAAIKEVFGRMGFSHQETVALVGAHTIGFCHKGNSGFDGPWKTAPFDFTNGYFLLLKEQLQNYEYGQLESTSNHQYTLKGTNVMMLPSDVGQVYDPDYAPFVDQYAASQDLWFNDFKAAFTKLVELGVESSLTERVYVSGSTVIDYVPSNAAATYGSFFYLPCIVIASILAMLW